MRPIVTNVQLRGFQYLVDSNKCIFCLNEPETLLHLFSDCSCVVDRFWNDLSD